MNALFSKKIQDEQTAMQMPCKSCYFFGGGSCNYLLMTETRRPCPPGDDCTEYRKAKNESIQKRLHKDLMETVYRPKPKRKKGQQQGGNPYA